MEKRHTISEDELLHHLRAERWEVYASSSGGEAPRKHLDVLNGGVGYRVIVDKVEVYRGQNVSDAVRAYNEAP